MAWELNMGASVIAGVGVRFRVWAPNARNVEVVLYEPSGPRCERLYPEGDGVHAALVPGVGAGLRYKYRLDGGEAFPDPYSRAQPLGVHGPSEVVDPTAFIWHDHHWQGVSEPLVIYECHVGTYTPQGTFDALIEQLPSLKALGVTLLELMPVAAFPGRWNWGYDGVALYAPCQVYGGPEALKRLIDAAHQIGLGVMLDVVYNHLGPDGNYLRSYAYDYFTDRHRTPWGDALNYDGRNRHWVRHFVIANACYWAHEYHVDGLRLDATHAIFDDSPTHILQEIAETVRALLPPERRVHLIAEDSRNLTRLIDSPERGGYGLDGVWADDFHHAMRTLLTHERSGYYVDYHGTTAELAKAINEGFLYQGEYSRFLRRPRGTPVTDQPAERFIFSIQNHDQIGNRAFGERLHHHTGLDRYAVATAVFLLAPETPLLFMGQEFAASAPFLYFTDHKPELGQLVTEGRRNEFASFPDFRDPERRAEIPDPQAESTFLTSKVDLSERERAPHCDVLELYRDLLRLRRDDAVLRHQSRGCTRAIAVTDSLIAVHRWHGREHRLLLANFGEKTVLPLNGLVAALDRVSGWRLVLSTERYVQGGRPDQAKLSGEDHDLAINVPAHCAVLLAGTTPDFR